MKKTITLTLAIICLIAINFNAKAQKKKYTNDGTMSATAPKPNIGSAAILATMGSVKIPYQDKTLAQFKGTIINNAEELVVFDNNNADKQNNDTYMVYLHKITAGEEKGGIKLVEYAFTLPLENTWYKNVVVTKVNDKQYNYTIYNVPLNTGVVVGFKYIGGTITIDGSGPLSNLKITNGFSEYQIYKERGTLNASPNYQATIAGQVLTLPTITISKPIAQVVN